jgi:membrane-associated phospholipid phosphatase
VPAFNPTLVRVAYWISTLGNPLVTALLFVGAMAYRLLAPPAAAGVVLSILLGVVVPMGVWTRRQVRRGAYTNFDVSERTQRISFYPRLIGLLLLAAGLLHGTGAPLPLRAGTLAAVALLTVCYLINFRLKVSLHAALSFFMAGGVLALSATAGIGALLVAALVAASRWVLGRHTVLELMVGTALGGATAAGLAAWLAA